VVISPADSTVAFDNVRLVEARAGDGWSGFVKETSVSKPWSLKEFRIMREKQGLKRPVRGK
jgi:hypothetical protein